MSSGIYQEAPKSNQEAFDRVWQTFVVEGKPRATVPGSKSCVYRTHLPDGTPHGCAVGIQLPDALYNRKWEMNKVFVLLVDKAIAEHFKDLTYGFLDQLQSAHDLASDLVSVRTNLLNLAKRWNLQIPAVVA